MSIIRSKDRPIVIEQAIDDSGITPEALRVYVHLLRLEIISPDEPTDFSTVAEHCFQHIQPDLRMDRLDAVLKELKELGLIEDDRMDWYAKMIQAYQNMSEEDKQALHNWEQEFVTGSSEYSTSDWPGWERYIEKKPSSP